VRCSGNSSKKPGGTLECLPIGGVEAQFRVGEVKFVFAAGHSDVEEAAFFLQGGIVLQGLGPRKHPLREPCKENGLALIILPLRSL